MKHYAFLLASVLALASCSHVDVTCVRVDPLLKVFPENVLFMQAPDTLDAAGGTHVEFQFALRSTAAVEDFTVGCAALSGPGGALIPAPRCGVVGYVGVGEYADYPAHDVLRSTTGMFPDPILENDSYSFDASCTFCPWITVHVPEGTPAGVYEAKVVMKGKSAGRNFEFEEPVYIKVWPVTMKKPDFPNVNWAFDFDQCLKLWNGGEKVEKWSDLHYEYLHQLYSILAEGYQTVTMVNIFDVVEMVPDGNGGWNFDFSRFDEYVALCEEHGVLDCLQGGELGHRAFPSWTAPMGLFVPVLQDGKYVKESLPVDDPRVREFYSCFIPVLKKHIDELGYADRYYQKVCDEPVDDNADSYCKAVGLLREYWPQMKVLEACQTTKTVGALDAWCPQLDFWHNNYDFYKKRQDAGDKVWFYTCCYPRAQYPNRFIEQPLLKTRLLYWMGFKYGADGYLHWGFNYWNDDPYAETVAPGTGCVLPGGDCWIVYPGERKFLRSIRFEQMRDGLEDLALLEMLSLKDPAAAKWIADSIVTNWWVYTGSPSAYRAAKRELLKALQ